MSRRGNCWDTRFFWQGDRMVAECADNDNIFTADDPKPAYQATYKSYLYSPDSFAPLAQLLGKGRKAEIYYYLNDHLGTPQELVNGKGQVAWSVAYHAYGNLAVAFVETVGQPLHFQGQYYDSESGLHYNRHRYYSPETARFITPDPIGLAGGLNQTQYVPNPTGWVDPLGLASKDCNDPLDYLSRKKLRTDVYNAQRPDGYHAVKHVQAKSPEEAVSLSLGKGARKGDFEASYLPEYANNVAGFEKQAAYGAIRNGNIFEHGGTRFMFYKNPTGSVGFNAGKSTNWVRVELTHTGTPVIHSFPASLEQVRKYIPGAN